MAPPVSLTADLGAYLLVQWVEGRVEVEGVGLTADAARGLPVLVGTAAGQAEKEKAR